MLNFQNLRAPAEDGQILIEPPAALWPDLLRANIRLRDKRSLTLAGIPVEELCRQTRHALLGQPWDSPVLACGHQPAFVHPGVWAKHVVVRAFAHRLGAAGLDFVVDHDAPQSFDLRVPVVGPDGLVHVEALAVYEAATGAAYEGQPPLGADAIASIETSLAGVLDGVFPSTPMSDYVDGLQAANRKSEIGNPKSTSDAVDQHLAARARVDARLDAELREARVSRFFGGPFVADLLLNAERFAEVYNSALADYRGRESVRSPHRPLPDLGRNGERTETALWIYRPLEARRRLWVARAGERIRLYAGASPIGDIEADALLRDAGAALAGLQPWVIRPRALTLTLWARLLACDLFVHGIGGAKYDRITDDLFRQYYGVEPPAYACVTATLRLPLPRRDTTPEDVAQARRACRDLHFNPDRYMESAPPALLAERRRLIAESGRLRAERAPRLQRREVFLAIRRINRQLVEMHPEVEQRLRQRLERLSRERESDRLAASREFFYMLQPRERLSHLARTLRAAAGDAEMGPQNGMDPPMARTSNPR